MLHTVRSKLLVGILLPLLIIYGLITFFETQRQVRSAIAETKQMMNESTEKRAAILNSEFVKFSAGVDILCDYIDQNSDASIDEITALCSKYVDANQQLIGFFIGFDPEVYPDMKDRTRYIYRNSDNKIAVDPLTNGYDFNRDVYMIPRFTQTGFWTEPYVNIEPAKQLICTLSVPFSRNKKFAGMLMADIGLDKIRDTVQSNTPENSRFCLVSRTGAIISDTNPDFEMNETIFSLAEWYCRDDLAQWGRRVLSNSAPTSRFEPVQNNLLEENIWNNYKPIWIASAPIRQTGWTLLVATDESEILKPIYVNLYQQLALFLLGLLAILGAIAFVSLRLTRSLNRLTHFAEELAAGNLDARVPGKRPNDEFGQLAGTFDQMVVELKSNIDLRMKESLARKAIEEELRVARRIQASLLPRCFPPFPDRNEFDLFARNEPAAFIAGDFFDFFFIDQDTLALVMADVSGHGIPAAMFMAVSRTAIRNFSTQERSPKEIIENANNVLSQDNDDCMFVTVFFALYNVRTGELTYVNAGHNPPYIVRTDGSIESMQSTGPFLATFEGIDFDQANIMLRPDDIFVTFTDGVTEAHTEAETILFGEARLERHIKEVRKDNARAICDSIFKIVDDYDHGEHHDDVTVMVLKRSF